MKELVYQPPMLKKHPHNYQILRNILYTFASVSLFFGGIISYGIVLNFREDSLVEAMAKRGLYELTDVRIIVNRKNYTLELHSGVNLVKSYKAVFGKNNSVIKTSLNDHATPIGKYKICSIDTTSRYHRFLKLDYPNERDAAEAFKNGKMNREDYEKLLSSENVPDAAIGIHGIGEYDFIFRNLPFAFNWTNGSVALSNDNIDELLRVVKIGTKVEIRN